MKRVLLVFNNLMDFTLTDVTMCLCDWVKYYASHETIQVDLYRANKWGFERNFNEFVRYAIENNYDYFFQYDADMTGHPKIIERLIAHDKECVGCLYLSRKAPHAAQVWNIKEINSARAFQEFHPDKIMRHIKEGLLIKSDVRASGFTLFKTEAIKDFDYPYGESKPNVLDKHSIDGFDMDITKKISDKYGSVWTDCSLENEVCHISNINIRADINLLNMVKRGFYGKEV